MVSRDSITGLSSSLAARLHLRRSGSGRGLCTPARRETGRSHKTCCTLRSDHSTFLHTCNQVANRTEPSATAAE
eukprot:5920816-Prymnesium_polylepis.1